jgi:predicted alpha/beta hydrolase family esterase
LADTANDVVQYFFNPSLRVAIQARLGERLAEAAVAFDHTILVSHSLGSVIAYDVLRQRARAYGIHTWFTTGSPLAKLAQLGAVTKDVGQISLGGVPAWHNLYDPSDVVASALGACFPFTVKDVIVENGGGVFNSHNYWGNSAAAELVAEAVRRRYSRLAL